MEDEIAPVENYSELEKVGQGAYGTVYKGKCNSTGDWVALKKVHLNAETEGVPSTALREISMLRELASHPCVVSLRDILYKSNNVLYMIFEFVDQDLRQFLDQIMKEGRELSSSEIQSYSFQLLCAMSFCHSHRIIHRDLKPQNLLVDSRGHLKLADFGLARVITMPPRQYTQEVVTLWYRPPEILMGSTRYQAEVDMWSIGCILAELALRRPIFPGQSEVDQLFKIFRCMGTPTEESWPGVNSLPHFNKQFPQWKRIKMEHLVPCIDSQGQDLLTQLFQHVPEDRILASEALQHPFFSDIDEEILKCMHH